MECGPTAFPFNQTMGLCDAAEAVIQSAPCGTLHYLPQHSPHPALPCPLQPPPPLPPLPTHLQHSLCIIRQRLECSFGLAQLDAGGSCHVAHSGAVPVGCGIVWTWRRKERATPWWHGNCMVWMEGIVWGGNAGECVSEEPEVRSLMWWRWRL